MEPVQLTGVWAGERIVQVSFTKSQVWESTEFSPSESPPNRRAPPASESALTAKPYSGNLAGTPSLIRLHPEGLAEFAADATATAQRSSAARSAGLTGRSSRAPREELPHWQAGRWAASSSAPAAPAVPLPIGAGRGECAAAGPTQPFEGTPSPIRTNRTAAHRIHALG